MGITFAEVTLAHTAPSTAAIAARVSEQTGLPVMVGQLLPAVIGKLHDLLAHLAFADHPRVRVEVAAYRRGAAREHLHATGMDQTVLARVTQGANEPADTQADSVQGYVGQEPTLCVAIVLALESLGSRPVWPVTAAERRM